MLELIDSHIHLDSEQYQVDCEQVIARAQAVGVSTFISIGASRGLDSARSAIKLAQKHSFIYATVGLHPHDAEMDIDQAEFLNLAAHPRVVAIGETGLDYYYDYPRDKQKEKFEFQIALGKQIKKPLIIHCRDALDDCLEILKLNNASEVGGVFHCYSGDDKYALKLRDINFKVSFTGNITFKKNQAMRDSFKNIATEQIMIETDGPYMAPEPFRGKRCESSHMLETLRCMATIKGLDQQDLAKQLVKNTKDFFRIA